MSVYIYTINTNSVTLNKLLIQCFWCRSFSFFLTSIRCQNMLVIIYNNNLFTPQLPRTDAGFQLQGQAALTRGSS